MNLEQLINSAPVVDPFSELSAEDKAETDMKAEIAIHIHEKRMGMNMSQEEFADFMGVSGKMVSEWESGEYNFSVDNLTRLMAALGLKLEIVPIPA